MQFDTYKLVSILEDLLNSTIKYKMSGNLGKVRPITKKPSEFSFMDCSGFVEYVIYHGTKDNLDISAGSWNQLDDIRGDKSNSKADYDTEAHLCDDVVRIGFRKTIIAKDEDGKVILKDNGRPKKAQVGHVWLVINGRTYESTTKVDKTKGPKSLKWDMRKKDADHFYKIGAAPGFGLTQLGLRASRRIAAWV